MKVRGCLILPALLGLALATGAARAAIWDPFSGYADVSAWQAEVDGLDRESFRQDYNIAFAHRLVPYVDLRLAYRYYDFDQDLELALGAYRKEVQPSGELRWNHPLFLASTSLYRREVDTTLQGTVVTNSAQAVAQTKDRSIPLFELRYDKQHTWYADDPTGQDIRNQRIQGSATWDLEQHNLHYLYSHVDNENVITDLTSWSDRHLFRWIGAGRGLSDGRMDLAGNYTFNHTSQTNEVRGGTSVLRPLPVLTGLYALDDGPENGPLAPRSGLADGNTDVPVTPPIDIGGANTDQNLGVDMGSVRTVAAMYIYTDRPSGELVRWAVWGSDDNLTWTQITGSPVQSFNAAVNRYELTIPEADFRFVKAVNSGLNEIAQVLVTELQVFEPVASTGEDDLTAISHLLDGRVGYRFNPRWRTSLDASFQFEELAGRTGDRNRASLGWRLNWEPSQRTNHNFNIDFSKQNRDGIDSQTDTHVGYGLALEPLETLRGSFSISDRNNWMGATHSAHIVSSAVEGSADLLYGLDATAGLGGSISEDFIGERRFNSWYVRARIQATLTRALSLNLDGNYRESLEMILDNLTTRRTAGLGLDWRVTRDLFARGTVRHTRERARRFTVEGLISWNILPSLQVSVQHYEIGTDDITTTLRQSANLNWDLSRRSNIYLRLAKVDLSGSGGTRTLSFQQGLRIGF